MKNISNELSPFATSLFKSLSEELVTPKNVAAKGVSVSFVDRAEEEKSTSLKKSILNVMNGGDSSIERLAFEADPSLSNQYMGLYKQKQRLLPDSVIKRMMIQDDLVAAIINARANQLATFGSKLPDRFSFGFVIEPEDDHLSKMTPEQIKEMQARIDVATKKLETCGETKGWDDENRLTFAQYLFMSTKNAVGLGRIATEIIWVNNSQTNRKEFHSFRPIDAGTIYRAAPQKEAAESIRKQALHLLEQIKNKDLEPERYIEDEYAWIQVLDGARPVQAFTSRECLVHNFYPVADVELDGYPVTPLDTVISAVTTHINITAHNRMYFQSGRAARGMLVIRSDDIDETVVGRIRQQFNASINSVSNAWRMPVFGVGSEDEISWQAIDSGQRDMEFQYLSDTNARVILSAFQMSPEELPGYAHLSRGTNNQALSESNNEYLLIAHRDVGLRPLVSGWEDFINRSLFPLIDENLAKICKVKLVGLDSETAEKESIRIQQDAPVHMTYDEILDKVEKEPVGKLWGGDFPLNPSYQGILDKYITVGQILEHFFGQKDASKDPRFDYIRDPYYFQFMQFQAQQQQMQQQMQMQQQQAAQGGGGGGPSDGGGGQPSGGDSGGDDGAASDGGGSPGANEQSAEAENQQAAQLAGQDLSNAVDQASGLLNKSEQQLPPSKRKVLGHHRAVVNHFMKGFQEASEEALREILNVAEKHAPKEKN
jgi:hypothetical protein